MPVILNHGGACCGMRHMRGMSFNYNSNIEQEIRDAVRQVHANRLIEVTMTDGQCSNTRVMQVLKAYGFKLVNRFRNSNSGNIVNVFHRIPVQSAMTGLPYEWENLTAGYARRYRTRDSGIFATPEDARQGARSTLVGIVDLSTGELVP